MSKQNRNILITSIIVFVIVIFFLLESDAYSPPPFVLVVILILILNLLILFFRMRFPLAYWSFLLKIFPRSARLHTHRSKVYLERRQYELAIQDCDQASALGSKRVDTYDNRGLAYLELQNQQQALEDFNHALSLNPIYATGYDHRGWAYMQSKEFEKAIQEFDQAIALFPRIPNAYYGKVIASLALDRTELAIQSCEQAIDIYPDKPSQIAMYYWRAIAYHARGEYKNALQDFFSVIESDPSHAAAYCSAAFSHVLLKEYQLAIQGCNRSIELDPQHADAAYNNRGKAYLGLDNLSQAQADFARAVEIDPAFITHHLYLTWTKLCQHKPDQEMANRLLEIANLKKNARHFQIYTAKGVACWIQGLPDEALQEFEQSIQMKKVQWDAYFWKGLVCATLKRDTEARAAIQVALDYNMPPILLSPLRWLEKDRPDFYQDFVLPLLAS